MAAYFVVAFPAMIGLTALNHRIRRRFIPH